MITKVELKRYLMNAYPYARDRRRSLETWLVRYLCSCIGYEPEGKLKDIAVHGCVSGCVNDLIYNADIVRFYQKYEPQIWDIVSEFLESTGETLGQFIDHFRQGIEDEVSLKVWLSWFAIECLAYRFLEKFNANF